MSLSGVLLRQPQALLQVVEVEALDSPSWRLASAGWERTAGLTVLQSRRAAKGRHPAGPLDTLHAVVG
jgi:hypothetical protein